ncbi:MAG: hypothetical protein CVU09_14450 [Bacteroidetes bacterium HGW-Bacteroidetes-4]|jgi:KDO2-lipid IV(A) lauroyltransferase|nr:MAG: hypothetical protein CVU09_14450 [Bacteroidetes bacterium HGW-Bacteroidetes-4]
MSFFEKIVYYVVLAWFWFLSKLPLRFLFFASELLTFLVYRLIGYRKKVVKQNLQNAFPNRDIKAIKKIARKYYRHLSVMIVENSYLRFVPRNQLVNHLVVEDVELFQKLYCEKRNVVLMLGHLGNWEMGGILSQFIPYRFAAVYKKLTSPVFDKIYFDIRSRLGVIPVEMKDVLRKVHLLNDEAAPFALFMVADQAPLLSETQHWIPFLNQDTGVYLGSEKLARKFDMAVVYLELIRIKKGSYRLRPTLITENPKETRPKEITERFFQLLEASILDAPRYWLWSHRRWKHKR